MKVKKVHICSENTNYVLELNSYWPLFAEVNKILTSNPGVDFEEDKLGQVDFAVRGDDITLLLIEVKNQLLEKLAAFEAPEHPSSVITLFDKRYDLDIRNDKHMIIQNIGVWLKMLEVEQERNGAVWFYNMSPVDEVNGRILFWLKKRPDGYVYEDLTAQVRGTNKSAAALSAEEFWERLAMLQEHQFITAEKMENGIIKWFPSGKTNRITSIY